MFNYSPDESRGNGSPGLSNEKLQQQALNLRQHPFIVAWHEFLKNGDQISANSCNVKIRQVVRFLEFVEKRLAETCSVTRESEAAQRVFTDCKVVLPGTLTHEICNNVKEHIDAYLAQQLKSRNQSPAPEASSIRKFVEWMSLAEYTKTKPEDVVTPGLSKKIKPLTIPVMEKWLEEEKPHPNQVGRFRKFLRFIVDTENISTEEPYQKDLEQAVLFSAHRYVPQYIAHLQNNKFNTQEAIKHRLSALTQFYSWAFKQNKTDFSAQLIRNPYNKEINQKHLPIFDDWRKSEGAPEKIYWMRRFAAEVSENTGIKVDVTNEKEALKALKEGVTPEKPSVTEKILKEPAKHFESFSESVGDSETDTGKHTRTSARSIVRNFYTWARENNLTEFNPPSDKPQSEGVKTRAKSGKPAITKSSEVRLPEATKSNEKSRQAAEKQLEKPQNVQVNARSLSIERKRIFIPAPDLRAAESEPDDRRYTEVPPKDYTAFFQARNRAIGTLMEECNLSFSDIRRLTRGDIQSSDIAFKRYEDENGESLPKEKMFVETMGSDTLRLLGIYEARLKEFEHLETKWSDRAFYFVANDGGALTVLKPEARSQTEAEKVLRLQLVRDRAITSLIRNLGSLEDVASLSLPMQAEPRNNSVRMELGGEKIIVCEKDEPLFKLLRDYHEILNTMGTMKHIARGPDSSPHFFRANDGGPLLADCVNW